MITLHPLKSKAKIPPATLATSESWFIFGLCVVALSIILNTLRSDGEPLLALVALSALGFAASFCLIKWLGPTFEAIGLSGEDMSKRKRKRIPEGMGVISGLVFLMVCCAFQAFGPYLLEKKITRVVGDQVVTTKVEHMPNTNVFYRFPHAEVSISCSPRILYLTVPSFTVTNADHP